MKTSNKILFVILGFFLFLIGLTIIRMGSFILYSHPNLVKFIDSPGKPVTNEYKFKDFTNLKFEGIWNVKIQRAESYSISLKAPEKLLKYIRVNAVGEELILKQEFFAAEAPPVVELSIFMPSLKSINVRGTNKIEFLGFRTTQMKIESFGANDIIGKNSFIEALELISFGLVDYELSESSVVNARLDLKGLGDVTLNIAGGKLEGRIGPNIDIEYMGNVSQKTLEVIKKADVKPVKGPGH